MSNNPVASVSDRVKNWFCSSNVICRGHVRTLIHLLILWYSWLARNNAKHRNLKMDSVLIIQKVIAFLQLSHQAKPFDKSLWKGDYQIAFLWNIGFPPDPPRKILKVVWSLPPSSFVKINTDGAVSQSTNLAAIGGLIRDDEGRILKAFQACIGHFSVAYSELVGIWKGIDLSKRMGFSNVILESDSQVALAMIKRPYGQWNWKLCNLISKILYLCRGMNISMIHIYREGNAAADWLACDSLKRRVSRDIDPGDVPVPVRQFAYADKRGIPYLRTVK